MPLFEYACRECGSRFEALVQGDRKPECSQCGSRKLEKQHSTFAAHSHGGSASGSASASTPMSASPGCGTCGDPRGPGSCRND